MNKVKKIRSDIMELLLKIEDEQTLKLIHSQIKSVNRESKETEARKTAAALLLADYTTDEELTAFTILDKEGF